MGDLIVFTRKIKSFFLHLYRKYYRNLFADMFVVSFPKSGRTWLRVILVKYFSDLYGEKIDLDFEKLNRKNKKIPFIVFGHLMGRMSRRNFYNRWKKRMNILRGKDVIFLVRDPRDVVVSYYFQATKREGFFQGSMDVFLRDPRFGISQIINYMNTIYAHREKYGRFLLIRYEDMQADIKKEVDRVFAFISKEPKRDDLIEKAISFGSFSNMKKLEERDFFQSNVLRAGDITDEETYKTRRGKVGGYKDYFSQDEAAFANEKMKKLNVEFGYSVD